MSEIVKDIKEMSIDEKLTRIQMELLQAPLKKSGHNKFGGFDYFELDDLIPHIIPLTLKYGCRLSFVFTEDFAIIRLKNWKDDSEVTSRSPMPPLEKLPKMNIAQVAGTYQTYFKRYLIYDLFCICEHDVLDTLENSVKDNQEKTELVLNKPKKLDKVIKKFHELHPDIELKKIGQLNNTRIKMFKNKELTDKENKEIYNYIKEGGSL